MRTPRPAHAPRSSRFRPLTGAALIIGLGAMVGCEIDSFFDPSAVGRWEHTPVTVPILDRVQAIGEESLDSLEVTPVSAQDLIADRVEYSIGSGDTLSLTIFEFLEPGRDSIFQRRVNETGQIRLPNIGSVEVEGLTPTQLESRLANVLAERRILDDAEVTVAVLAAQQNTYSIIGQPNENQTAFGTYVIPRPNFRLLDAIATARGIDGRVKRLLVIREVVLDPTMTGETDPGIEAEVNEPAPTGDDLLQGLEAAIETGSDVNPDQPEDRDAPPPGVDVVGGDTQNRFVYLDGKWVRTNQAGDLAPVVNQNIGALNSIEADLEELSLLVTQRIVEVPYDRLRRGDLRYNIVIRPGDIITVPERSAGFVYAMGTIARPGAFNVPGEDELTIKQLIASAGGLGGTAVPERVDLIRRIGDNKEAIIRLNLRAIFNGTEPDIFLKPNDLLNFGTNFAATPLAVFRNGLRVTYGVGFILDRNFGNDVFGDP